MYSMVKRVSVFALALLTLVMGVVVPYRRAEAAIMYNNTLSSSINCTVNTSGKLNAQLRVAGITNVTTKIAVELYVEKRILGLFWSRVDIGCEDNIWRDSTTNYYYTHTFSYQLNSSGTYRVTVTYTVSGTNGANDIITLTDTVTN